MTKAEKELIAKAKPRTSDTFDGFYVINSGKAYDGTFGKNGYNNIILVGFRRDESEPVEYELITDHSDVASVCECGYFSIDISHDDGIVRIFFGKRVRLSFPPLSSCLFEGGHGLR